MTEAKVKEGGGILKINPVGSCCDSSLQTRRWNFIPGGNSPFLFCRFHVFLQEFTFRSGPTVRHYTADYRPGVRTAALALLVQQRDGETGRFLRLEQLPFSRSSRLNAAGHTRQRLVWREGNF